MHCACVRTWAHYTHPGQRAWSGHTQNKAEILLGSYDKSLQSHLLRRLRQEFKASLGNMYNENQFFLKMFC